MLFRVLVLVLSMLSMTMLANVQGNTPPPVTALAPAFLPPVQEQPIHYTCDGDKVLIKINRTKVDYYAVSKKPDVNHITDTVGACENTFKEIPPTNQLVELTGCEKTAPLYIFVMKRPNDTKSVVVGGANYHRYVINCHVAGTPNYQVSVSATVSPKPDVTENPNLKLKMTIANAKQSDTIINIGDELTMTVSETGTFGNYLAFVDCTAVETDKPDNKIELLKNKASKEPDIITGTQTVPKGGSVSLNFYAFRFKSSNSVTIKCTVEACNGACVLRNDVILMIQMIEQFEFRSAAELSAADLDSRCLSRSEERVPVTTTTTTITLAPTPSGGRRRRSDRHSTAEPMIGSVKATFEIADESTGISGGNKASPVATPLLAVLLTITMALFK